MTPSSKVTTTAPKSHKKHGHNSSIFFSLSSSLFLSLFFVHVLNKHILTFLIAYNYINNANRMQCTTYIYTQCMCWFRFIFHLLWCAQVNSIFPPVGLCYPKILLFCWCVAKTTATASGWNKAITLIKTLCVVNGHK